MASQWILIALVLAGGMAPLSLYLHRKGRTQRARALDVAALAWLFYLVHLVAEGPPLLTGALMFLGCFHLGLLMGWVPIRRDVG